MTRTTRLWFAPCFEEAWSTEFKLLHSDRLKDARAAALQSPPDCILLDLTLPDAHWLEAPTELQALVPDVPIVILSGLDDESLAIKAVHEGAQDYLVKGHTDGYLLGRSIRYAIERKRAQAESANRSMYDSLTQLPNRELFTDRVSHALARRKKSGYPVGVVFIRLEDFELINDSLGRPAGKQLLRAVADRLRHLARVRDTVAYIGSDSFGILCDTAYGGQYRINTVGRVRKSFEQPFDLEGEQVYAAARIGTAVGALGADEHPETLILRAEAGAYERELERASR